MRLPPYPRALEEWWWEQATSKWPDWGKEKLLNSIRREVVEQSDRFNKTRSFESSSYGSRDLSILSYGNFFFPRTWQATQYGLAEAYGLRNWRVPTKGPLRILDLGSGSGAGGLSVIHLLRALGVPNPIMLEAFDYSGKSLATMKNVHQACPALWPKSSIKTRRQDLRDAWPELKTGSFDLVLLGFSLNELSEGDSSANHLDWLMGVARHLKPSGVLLILEPADSRTCSNLQRKSFALTSKKPALHQHAPYFNGRPCPFISGKSKYYSHEVRKIIPTGVVDKINAPLHLETRTVKFGLSILGKRKTDPVPEGPGICRLVSPVKKTKGTLSFVGIGADGKEYRYEFQRRDLQREEKNQLMALERGDVIRLPESIQPMEEDRMRLSSTLGMEFLFVPRVFGGIAA